MALSEQELLRRQKRQDLMAMGIDPYPADLFEVNVTAADIEKNYENWFEEKAHKNVVSIDCELRLSGQELKSVYLVE